MSLPNPYMQYRQNAVQGASPGELTLMLYDGLVKFIMLAVKSLEQNDVGGAHNALMRSQAIVSYLSETLDRSYDVSKGLASLYEYMNRRLMEANVKKDARIADEILGLVRELRGAWQQAVKITKGQR